MSALVTVAVALALAGPDSVAGVAGTCGWSADSSAVLCRTVTTISRPLGPRDVIRYTTYRNTVRAAEVRSTATDTVFTFLPPGYDSTAVYRVCGRWFRGTTANGAFKCQEASVSRGPAPEPEPGEVLDIQITPPTASVSQGDTLRAEAEVRSSP